MDKCTKCLKNKKISFLFCKSCLKWVDPILFCEMFGDCNNTIIVSHNLKSFDTLDEVDFKLWVETFNSYTGPKNIKTYPSYNRIKIRF